MTERALTESQHRFTELLGLHVLTDALVVRQLQSWYANLAKRQVKSPKIYIRDSGLLHLLLGKTSLEGLLDGDAMRIEESAGSVRAWLGALDRPAHWFNVVVP